jgi:hypothetical protein
MYQAVIRPSSLMGDPQTSENSQVASLLPGGLNPPRDLHVQYTQMKVGKSDGTVPQS